MAIFLEQKDKLWTELERFASEQSLALYEVERFGDQGLRVVLSTRAQAALAIDSDSEIKSSVSSEDCFRFCKRLRIFLSVEGGSFGLGLEPRLEVSSPGINRELRKIEHFLGAIGERVHITWNNAEGREVAIGNLEEVGGGEILVYDEESNSKNRIEIDKIKKARIDFKF
jgi:ribosome maturation factor RimP